MTAGDRSRPSSAARVASHFARGGHPAATQASTSARHHRSDPPTGTGAGSRPAAWSRSSEATDLPFADKNCGQSCSAIFLHPRSFGRRPRREPVGRSGATPPGPDVRRRSDRTPVSWVRMICPTYLGGCLVGIGIAVADGRNGAALLRPAWVMLPAGWDRRPAGPGTTTGGTPVPPERTMARTRPSKADRASPGDVDLGGHSPAGRRSHSRAPQQRLNFFPLPHGHGSFRPMCRAGGSAPDPPPGRIP